MRVAKLTFVVVLFTLLFTSLGTADTYPTRLIKIIVPWPAGGVADFLARIAADGLSRSRAVDSPTTMGGVAD
jgi:tripartite-type tricarboxylate transporter receptor subunit TctC